MKNIFMDEKLTIPDGYDLSAKVPMSTIVVGFLTLAAIIAVVVSLIVVIRRHQKGTMFGFFGGLATYLIFFYFATRGIIGVVFGYSPLKVLSDSPIIFCICLALTAAVFPILGRMLTMKIYAFKWNSIKDIFAFGLGIMCMEALMAVMGLFTTVMSCFSINNTGIAEIIKSATTQSELESLLESIFQVINYSPVDYIFSAVMVIEYLLFHVAVSVPLFAAFEKKISKLWYLISMGMYFVIELAAYLFSSGIISPVVEAIAGAFPTAGIIYFAVKIYNEHYKDEENSRTDTTRKSTVKTEEPKKMPKFGNLSNL